MSQKLTLDIIMSRANTKKLESIKTLNLWGLNLSDLSILSGLPLLETISLSNNQIKDISIFKEIKNIKELYLADNQISELNQIENLKNCKKLEKLVLKGNPISNNPNYIKKILETLPNLLILDEKDIKSLKKENKDLPFIKNKAQKMNVTNNPIYKTKRAAPSPEEVNHQNQNF